MKPLLQIHSMHGPTVYVGHSWSELPEVLAQLARLNSPASNAGLYRLFVNYAPDPGLQPEYHFVPTEQYEIVPLPTKHESRA